MRQKTKLTAILSIFILVFTACGGETAVVESGTYSGTITEVNASETEIYVNLDSGETIELYFTDETTLTLDGEAVPFTAIQVDDSVEVTVEKTGKRLDPVSVVLLN
ncbi:hypothetical protein [Gracilimonas halophila]|uniref:DUF1344 domain-containing protein n=1 Tax=Gracilimonas halophila TaxID=1834464 RepID=A0ABW5JI76_9BACT